MEAVLARASKVAAQAEVFTATSEETSAQFEANRLKHVQTRQSATIALRLIKDGRIGYAFAAGPADPQALVDMAVETARFGMQARFDLPAPAAYPNIATFDRETPAVPIERMTGLGEEMIAAVRQHTPDVLCQAGVSRSDYSVSIINSRGGRASYRKSIFSLGVEGTLIRGTDMLFVGEGEMSCCPILNTTTITDTVRQQLELAKSLAPVPSQPLPVIFTSNGIASALVSPLMAAFNGKLVLEGASPLAGKLGEALFDSKLHLWDDPTVAFRPESRPCDDEGVPSQRTPLVEAGKVSSFLYDLQTAAMAGTRSTGSGSRGRGGLPAPAPSAFVIAPGNTTMAEMVSDIKEGLVIEQVMGAEQGNILGGDFSGNVLLGFKIENGKMVGRVKDTMVSGNVFKLLKEIAAIGSEARWVGGFLSTPPLYFPRLSVASKGQG
ncbi:MAG: TldD/PmbA family protein [Chloroflexi bacterium]|nr:TldD/PmbA family protein [Chloroflexota bacterium]